MAALRSIAARASSPRVARAPCRATATTSSGASPASPSATPSGGVGVSAALVTWRVAWQSRGHAAAGHDLRVTLVVSSEDYHTAGEPFRIVTGGVPELQGATILERRRFALAEPLDHVRRLLVHEPRGHADMYGCFVTPPVAEGSSLGVVFFHKDGFSTACGHGTIALVTWALEGGRVAGPVDGVARLSVDVPSGTVRCEADVAGGRVRAVRMENVPSFVHVRGVDVEALGRHGDGRRRLRRRVLRLAAGGRAGPRGRARAPDRRSCRRAARSSARSRRRRCRCIRSSRSCEGVYGVIFHDDLGGDAAMLHQRNVTVFADGEVDRSPCGSGTSARLALLHAEGALAGGRRLRHDSIIGTTFHGWVPETTAVDGRAAVTTVIEGRAFRTGRHVFELDPDDEVGLGFALR